ncbi:hypothetical protein PIB30_081599 [Stylosanthes scabra]|uniref:Uncharacterized protein n=1 Tax=Stylosanthes scabra TaxID=79078 RepID=A0ABU6UQK1_9FABA|nr:hypothetical protein [Stylosanthes scabra]
MFPSFLINKTSSQIPINHQEHEYFEHDEGLDRFEVHEARVHEPASRFGSALRLPGRSGAESAAFGSSRLNPGSAPVHLVEPVNGLTNPFGQPIN